MKRKIEQIGLVRNTNDVVKNIKAFHHALKNSRELRRRLKLVHAWYAYEVPNGDWIFGNSKFIGFRDLTVDEYLEYYNQGLHGWDTESRLGEWYSEIDSNHIKFTEMHERLKAFLQHFDREPRSKVRIYVVDKERDKANPEIISWPSDKVVDLMVEVANILPSKNLRDLRKRLSV